MLQKVIGDNVIN